MTTASLTDLRLRPEQPADYPAIAELIAAAFAPLEVSDSDEPLLVHRLRQTDAYLPELWLVAEHQDRILGHILLTKVHIVQGEEAVEALALAPVSVLPDYQRKGIGSRLIRAAHRNALEQGYRAVVLIGHANYYPRFGYRPAEAFDIVFPFPVPKQFCMALELYEGALKGISGQVVYPPAFFGKQQ